MKDAVFVSTSGFKREKIEDIFDECEKNGIFHVELSAVPGFDQGQEDFLVGLCERGAFHFSVHNYFPPPQETFILNLASNDADILVKSREHCYRAIDLSCRLGTPFYGVHCGFAFHAQLYELGHNLLQAPRFSLKEAEEIFIQSLKIVADYAQEKGTQLIIENNVLSRENLAEGGNVLFLGVTAEELMRYIEKAGRKNLGVLLDVGHLKVSAESLGFDARHFIRVLAPWIKAVHLSDNDGAHDAHLPVTSESWFWEPLESIRREDMVPILEAGDLTPDLVKDQFRIIRSRLLAGGE